MTFLFWLFYSSFQEMAARMENNNGGQNVGGQRGDKSQGPAFGQLRNTCRLQFGRASDRWVLKMVESGYSFKSADNIPQLLCLMDKESKVFLKMTLGRKKCGYYVSHALYHFYFEALIKRILGSPCLHLGRGWRPEKDDRHCHKVV